MNIDQDRKKALKKEYQRTPKQMGVYSILNTQNHRRFVGVSRDVEARLNRHRFMLKTNSERDFEELQIDWNSHGPDAFEFKILEVLDPPKDEPNYNPEEDLDTLHQLWFEQLNPVTPNGYNQPL